MTINKAKIGFIGAGNMARSIIGGLVSKGFDKKSVSASDPNPDARAYLRETIDIDVEQNNEQLAAACDVIILAVKPQSMKTVCESLSTSLRGDSLVVSVAAGIDCASLNSWLGEEVAVVRCMPNTPALVGEAASALYATAKVAPAQKELAQQIMRAVGSVHWVHEEPLLDAVTAVSGSGPAYFFLVLEAMTEAGVQLGLEKQTASDLAIQTAFGAAKLARESKVDPAELRRRVTSPKGTTEKAIASFEKNQIRRIFAEAMQDCATRSSELSRELGANTAQ